MTPKLPSRAHVDAEGKLILPKEIASRYGLEPGMEVRVDEVSRGILMRQPATRLQKVYIEPTNGCNLDCRTCIRKTWDEPLGQMNEVTFDRTIESLRLFSPAPTILFGGFGEPLSHPKIVDMIAKASTLGGVVELITNGTLLSKTLSFQLIKAGLDVLWVSLDGASPQCYEDVRRGALFSEVLANVTYYRNRYWALHGHLPHIGIVFVAMKRNIADLPAVMNLGRRLTVDRFMVTNVLPHTVEMCSEVLYDRLVRDIPGVPTPWSPQLRLSRMEVGELTREALYQVMKRWRIAGFAGVRGDDPNDWCPFVGNASTAIRWDGSVSPCLPLLHSHTSFLHERKRSSRSFVVGNVDEQDVEKLWSAPPYASFRERVQGFDFSPCAFCGGCDLSEGNEGDCFGNVFPTCGGCLWAQGVIRCP
jgi:MoaA/NifB/PqqE/SkfB family radical SAM enzyme